MSRDAAPPPRPATGLAETAAWAGLLASAVELAQSTLALPDDAEGERWRRSVAPLVECVALRLALAELPRLSPPERLAARDLAAVSLRRAAGRLDSLWRGVPMPEAILEIAEEADLALRTSVYAGLRMAILAASGAAESPAWMPSIDAAWVAGEGDRFARSTAAAMAPGTLVLQGSPVAWWTGCPDPDLDPKLFAIGPAESPLQVYREIDPTGRFMGDLVCGLDALPPGMPLIVPLRLDGERIGSFPIDADAWREAQQRALAGRNPSELPLRRTEG